MKRVEKGRSRSMSLPVVLHYNQKIANYSKQKQYQLACQVFEQMLQNHINPDVVTFNTMINVYVKSQRLNDAFELFDQMKKSNISPTIVTYTSLIDGCGKFGNLERAIQVYTHVKEIGIPLNMHFFNAILNATFLQGNIRSVEMILNDIKQSGLHPNTVTYNTMLAGYIRLNLLSKMQSTIEEMISFKVEFSNITQTAIFQGIQLVKDQRSLNQFISLLNTSKLVPSQAQASQLISELVTNRFLLLAQQLCAYLISVGCQISSESFSLIIELAGFFSNIDIIQWCSEKATKFGYNMSFQIFLSQLCLFARFNNYEKVVQTYEQITFNHELIPSHVKLSLINCFLSHEDVQRSLNTAQKWISECEDTSANSNENVHQNSTSNSPFSAEDADQLLSLFYERSLFNEVVTISQMIREMRSITLSMRASNFTLLASLKTNQFHTLVPSISEFSPSCDIITEIVNNVPLTVLSLIPLNTLIDNCCTSIQSSQTSEGGSYLSDDSIIQKRGVQNGTSSLPTPTSLTSLIRSLVIRKMEKTALTVFKRFTSLGVELTDESLHLLIQCVRAAQPADECDVNRIIACAREASVELPEELYTMGVDAAIKNGDYSTAVALKIEMDAAGLKLGAPTESLFKQNYECIRQALPEAPPPVARRPRRRSRTMPTPNAHHALQGSEKCTFSDCEGGGAGGVPLETLNEQDDGMDEITKRSVMMVLGEF